MYLLQPPNRIADWVSADWVREDGRPDNDSFEPPNDAEKMTMGQLLEKMNEEVAFQFLHDELERITLGW